MRWRGSIRAVGRALQREMGRLGSNAEYRAVVWWLPLGLVIFFAIFFSQEVVGPLPVAVVDWDDTPLSRKVVSMIRTTPETRLVEEFADMDTARRALLEGRVVGVVEIEAEFERKVLSGESAVVVYYDSGTNISANSLSAKGVQTAVATFGAGVAVEQAKMEGTTDEEALAQAMPIALSTYALFNPWLNYAYYIAPCFLAMVLIIATMLSTIYAVGGELRDGSSVAWLRSANGSVLGALVGKLIPATLALWLLAVVIGVVLFGVFGAPMRGEWAVLAVGVVALIWAYQSIAVAVVALTASMRLSLSLGGGYSVLAFTFSGVTFPTMAMLSAVQPLTMLFPYTYFMRLYIDQAVRGSAWWLSMQDLSAMLLFCLVSLFALGRLRRVSVNRKFWGRL